MGNENQLAVIHYKRVRYNYVLMCSQFGDTTYSTDCALVFVLTGF